MLHQWLGPRRCVLSRRLSLFLLTLLCSSCSVPNGTNEEFYEGPNPFTEPLPDGKEDSGYVTRRGVEVHITLEADVEAPASRIFDAPAELALYAFSALKRDTDDVSVTGHEFYAMALADGLVNDENLEWLVDDTWITTAEARQLAPSELRRFRIRNLNAAVFDDTVYNVRAGQSMEVTVPIRPYSTYGDLGDACALEYPGIGLSQDVYWFLWLPTWTCRQTGQVQTMAVTVEEVIERPDTRYPEYDELWQDGVLDVVAVFGVLDHGGSIEDDDNWERADRFADDDLSGAGFLECDTEACQNESWCQSSCGSGYLGRRFIAPVADDVVRVDIYYPNLFHSVSDRANFDNWQRAVSDHEVVMYLGHAVLGQGIAYEQVEYPDFYQIHLVFACLSYGYYVQPLYEGHGGWETLDVIALADLGKPHEIRPMISHLIRGLMEGFENGGRNSWQDIMSRVGYAGRISRAGLSGVSDNCFSPDGDLCNPEPEPEPEPEPNVLRYENDEPLSIPDDDDTGVTSIIEIDEDALIGSLTVDLSVTHTYRGDLEITLSHDDVTVTLWDRDGGSEDNISETIALSDFGETNAAGTWTLRLIDHAAADLGELNAWALNITPR